MTVFITAVHLVAGSGHEHIDSLRWLDSGTEKSKVFTRAACVDWLTKGNKAYVATEDAKVEVRVVDAHPPYVRTVANNRYTDNLLSLPTF